MSSPIYAPNIHRGHVHDWRGPKNRKAQMRNILPNQNHNATKRGMLIMPYRVEATENNDYAVVYFFQWDTNATAEVFWSEDRIVAEAEANRLNELENKIDLRLQQAFDDLRSQIKESDDELLTLMAGWVKEKQIYLKEG